MTNAQAGLFWLVAIIVVPSAIAYLFIVTVAWAKHQTERGFYARGMARQTAKTIRHMEDIAKVYQDPEARLDAFLRDDNRRL